MASHLERSELEEGGKGDPPLRLAKGTLLTNGHARLVNGALKPEDSSSDTDEPSVGKGLENAAGKPQSRAEQFDTKPDPYEFPLSPSKEQEQQSSSQDQPSKPLPRYQGAGKAAENHSPAPPCPPETNRSSLTKSPVRLNGCHGRALADNTPSSSKAPVQLLAQTGGLISEYYSHSRLHQISTWRTSFSEYVNELHSRRKAAAAPSFPGKERLRKLATQHVSEGRLVSMLRPLVSRQFNWSLFFSYLIHCEPQVVNTLIVFAWRVMSLDAKWCKKAASNTSRTSSESGFPWMSAA